MVEFFEKIQAESKGNASQFLSDHPNPTNRISNVQHEIEKLNGALPDPKRDTPEFQDVKHALTNMAPPSRSGRPTTGGTGTSRRPTTNGRSTGSGTPANPSTRLTTYSGSDIEFRYPENWRDSEQGTTITVAPEGGMINGSLTWGLMISLFEPEQHGQGPVSLDDATDQLLNALQRNNSAMHVTRRHEAIRVGGQSGYLAEASNDSPSGGRETDWIVTTIAPSGKVYYFVGVAPQNDYNTYSLSFQDIIDTVRFRN
jgi:hypothetical protein